MKHKKPNPSEAFAEASRVCLFEHVPGEDAYDESALDKLVANFSGEGRPGKVREKLGEDFNSPLVIGHDEDQEILKRSDLPAAGWVSRVWREGRKLFGDLVKVPETVAAAIKNQAYRTRSAEIYRDYKGMGPHLRRVALLGGDIPARKTLGEIAFQTYAEEGMEIDRITRFAETEAHQMTIEELKALVDAQAKDLAEIKAKLVEAEKPAEEPPAPTADEKFAEMEKANAAQKAHIDTLTKRLTDVENTRRFEKIELRAKAIAGEKNVYNEDLVKSWVEDAKKLPAEAVDMYFEAINRSVTKTVTDNTSTVRGANLAQADEAADRKEYDSWAEQHCPTKSDQEKFSFEWWKSKVK